MLTPIINSTKLPSKKALMALGKSKQTIQDYGKATPVGSLDMAPVLQQLRMQQMKEK
jgi:hypothetical protein